MAFERIDLLVTKHGFVFQAWDDRYSKGVWAVCTPSSPQAAEIWAASEDSDVEMFHCTSYVLGTEWLPVEIGPSLLSAMAALEDRLSKLPADQMGGETAWASAVRSALGRIQEVRSPVTPLPKDFAGVLQAGSGDSTS